MNNLTPQIPNVDGPDERIQKNVFLGRIPTLFILIKLTISDAVFKN